MIVPDRSACADEEARLRVLAEHDVLGKQPDPTLGHIVEFAAHLFDAPTAFISFIDRNRQVFHAKFGIELCETDRDVAFCTQTIAQEEPLVILDASKDPNFRDNPLVTGPPFIRFYAGAPLRTDDHYALGSLCLLSSEPRREFTANDRRILNDLACLAADRLQLHRVEAARQATQIRFERIADTSPDAIVCADANGRINFWSSSAERLFGL
jgi:GAF domain-containing protein